MNADQPPDVPHGSQPVTAGPAHATAPPGHETITALLKQTRPWVLLIAVLVAVGAGLTLLGGLAFAALFAAAPEFADLGQMPRGFGGGIVLLYLVFGAVYLVPSIWLFRYSGRITRYLEAPDQGTLGDAIAAQKSFWKFTGIAALCVIALYFLLVAGVFLLFATQGF